MRSVYDEESCEDEEENEDEKFGVGFNPSPSHHLPTRGQHSSAMKSVKNMPYLAENDDTRSDGKSPGQQLLRITCAKFQIAEFWKRRKKDPNW